jgi:peptidoglycan/LPS O-acetylase OafA/YrhL
MGLYWTLEYELAFYAACYVLLALGWLRKPFIMAAAVALFLCKPPGAAA